MFLTEIGLNTTQMVTATKILESCLEWELSGRSVVGG